SPPCEDSLLYSAILYHSLHLLLLFPLTRHPHSPAKTSACLITSATASSCPSGGYLYFFNSRLIIKRMAARTLSRCCQSTVVLARIFSVSSLASFFRVASPMASSTSGLAARAS